MDTDIEQRDKGIAYQTQLREVLYFRIRAAYWKVNEIVLEWFDGTNILIEVYSVRYIYSAVMR